ncbi:DNA cytosine methyltransferase [Marispirochaeta sp.]|uniref:DNA cytosine methyltransferase n=1 Tax=Marispirochaeta sp. TaxID=2038653 RepID=UPI0029C8418B|nr:DNA cytosine methyltransferase [Marispirochaeta sp.]
MNDAIAARVIDLFAGAGGLSIGFERLSRCPFKFVWANDYNKDAADTYRRNFDCEVVDGDIVTILEEDVDIIPQADIVIGGPPCQGFSLLNKNKSDDPRKHLWTSFMKIVELSGASIFLMENVPQILSTPEGKAIISYAEDNGFKVTKEILSAADYGVPQLRRRAFIVGSRHVDPKEFFPPKRTHFNPERPIAESERHLYIKNPQPWRTVRHAIEDLPEPAGTEIRHISHPLDLHFGRNPTELSMKRYRAIPKEGMNRFDLLERAPELTPECWIRKTKGGTDLFGRLWWDRPSVTIRTEFFKPEKGRYLHPSQHRPITHREAARIQSFPDDFKFIGSKIEIAKQIGNAVPPQLAAAVAQTVYAIFNFASNEDEILGEAVV